MENVFTVHGNLYSKKVLSKNKNLLSKFLDHCICIHFRLGLTKALLYVRRPAQTEVCTPTHREASKKELILSHSEHHPAKPIKHTILSKHRKHLPCSHTVVVLTLHLFWPPDINPCALVCELGSCSAMKIRIQRAIQTRF